MKIFKILIAVVLSLGFCTTGFCGDRTGINRVPDGPTKVEKA
jgi:hypothetical protein